MAPVVDDGTNGIVDPTDEDGSCGCGCGCDAAVESGSDGGGAVANILMVAFSLPTEGGRAVPSILTFGSSFPTADCIAVGSMLMIGFSLPTEGGVGACGTSPLEAKVGGVLNNGSGDSAFCSRKWRTP